MILMAIYLTGYVAAYFMLRLFITRGDMGVWTVRDRVWALVWALTSWIAATVGIVGYISERIEIDYDKPAKW